MEKRSPSGASEDAVLAENAALFSQAVGNPPAIPGAKNSAVFLDLDGTLLEFAMTPDAIRVEPNLRALLLQLATVLNGALAIVSGRPLTDIDSLLGLPKLAVVGQHGGEMRLADGRVHRAAIDPQALDSARALVMRHPALANGVRVEDKGVALAFHYREVPSAEPLARELAADALESTGPGFELLRGNFVIELKSARVDKGRALGALMEQAPFRGRTPWMLGDDYTDEPAFAIAQSLGGTGVIVGPARATIAHASLRDVASVHAWLQRLAGS